MEASRKESVFRRATQSLVRLFYFFLVDDLSCCRVGVVKELLKNFSSSARVHVWVTYKNSNPVFMEKSTFLTRTESLSISTETSCFPRVLLVDFFLSKKGFVLMTINCFASYHFQDPSAVSLCDHSGFA